MGSINMYPDLSSQSPIQEMTISATLLAASLSSFQTYFGCYEHEGQSLRQTGMRVLFFLDG